MIPIHQTALYGEHAIGNGNCVAAAMASILELPLWMMPAWDQMFGRPDWEQRRRRWLSDILGLSIDVIWLDDPNGVDDQDKPKLDTLPEFYIACGPTSRGTQHAVVYSDGKLVHDPHPQGDGLEKVRFIWFFTPSKEAQDRRGTYRYPLSATERKT